MSYIADLHVHSRYSRATSRDMVPDRISEVAKTKGIGLMGTGDIVHPLWRKELRDKLREGRNGIYTYRDVDYILTGEVSNIYRKGDRTRKVHVLLLFPDFETVDAFAKKLALYGNLDVDGRPTLSLDVLNMLDMAFSVSEDITVIPAHIWTPWFSMFGANSGFDTLEECLGHHVDRIAALETGLSSDPSMNWRVSALDRYPLVSNSDAHSPNRIGRECNVFSGPLDYFELRNSLFRSSSSRRRGSTITTGIGTAASPSRPRSRSRRATFAPCAAGSSPSGSFIGSRISRTGTREEGRTIPSPIGTSSRSRRSLEAG
jgi:PHP family Zn ribbon phosphoesterase